MEDLCLDFLLQAVCVEEFFHTAFLWKITGTRHSLLYIYLDCLRIKAVLASK